MKRSAELAVLGVILSIAVAFRTAYLVEMAHDPQYFYPSVDAAYHHYWANALVTGNWEPPPGEADPLIYRTPYFRLPGYPYFLAAVYRLFGTGVLAPRIVQMFLGLLNVILAFLLGRRLFGKCAALVLAGLMSSYWSFIYFEGEFLEPVLLVTLGLLLFYTLVLWTDEHTFLKALAAGILLGVFALVRSNVLLFLLVSLPWSWRVSRRQELSVRRWALLMLAFVCGTVLAISPATVRNISRGGDFVLISSNDGINLFIGNNARADGKVTGAIQSLGVFRSSFDYPALVRSLERKLGRNLKYSEASAWFRTEALSFMRERPAEFLSLMLKKTLLFWGPNEVGHNREDESVRAHSGILRKLPGGFSFALASFVLGLVIFRTTSLKGAGGHDDTIGEATRRHEAVALMCLFIAAYFASHLPFFVAGRYRVPLVPFLLLMGSYGICRLVRGLLWGNRRQALAWAVVGAVLYGIFSLNATGYRPDEAKWHYQKGIALTRVGDMPEAIEEYLEAIRLNPRFADAHVNAGFLLKKMGRENEAKIHLVQALEYKPDSAEAHANLGEIFFDHGLVDEAIEEYQKALSLRPELADVHFDFGLLLADQGRIPDAAGHFSEAIRINPFDAEAHAALGAMLANLGDVQGGGRHLRRALQLNPGLEPARDNLRRLENGRGPLGFNTQVP